MTNPFGPDGYDRRAFLASTAALGAGALGLVDREVEIFGVLVDGTDMAVVQVTVSRVP